jgi:hypothetical protein
VSRTFIVFHLLPTFHEPFVPFRNSLAWHTIITVQPPLTVGQLETFCIFFFQFHKKFQIDALLDFYPSHESGRATQHGHTQIKFRGKPADSIERWIQSCLIWEGSRLITFNCSPLLQVSLVQCAQPRCFVATPRILKQSWKAVVTKHLLVLEHSG